MDLTSECCTAEKVFFFYRIDENHIESMLTSGKWFVRQWNFFNGENLKMAKILILACFTQGSSGQDLI